MNKQNTKYISSIIKNSIEIFDKESNEIKKNYGKKFLDIISYTSKEGKTLESKYDPYTLAQIFTNVVNDMVTSLSPTKNNKNSLFETVVYFTIMSACYDLVDEIQEDSDFSIGEIGAELVMIGMKYIGIEKSVLRATKEAIEEGNIVEDDLKMLKGEYFYNKLSDEQKEKINNILSCKKNNKNDKDKNEEKAKEKKEEIMLKQKQILEELNEINNNEDINDIEKMMKILEASYKISQLDKE